MYMSVHITAHLLCSLLVTRSINGGYSVTTVYYTTKELHNYIPAAVNKIL